MLQQPGLRLVLLGSRCCKHALVLIPLSFAAGCIAAGSCPDSSQSDVGSDLSWSADLLW